MNITTYESVVPTPRVFILGTQRAGTTLLTRILSAHSEIFIQNEISVEKVFTNFDKQEILTRMNLQFTLRHGCSVSKLLNLNGKKYWGVKDPEFTEHFEALELFAKESKFVLIVRDGRGVVNSYIENKWGLGTNAYTGAKRWSREIRAQLKFKEKFPDKVLLVRYEDLVSETESIMKKVCMHLEIKYEPEMLNYSKSKASYQRNPSNINTDKRPDKSLMQRWQRKLSEHQINIIEKVSKKELKLFDYEPVGEDVELSPLQIAYYKLHQLAIGEIQIQYQLKRIWIKEKLFSRKG